MEGAAATTTEVLGRGSTSVVVAPPLPFAFVGSSPSSRRRDDLVTKIFFFCTAAGDDGGGGGGGADAAAAATETDGRLLAALARADPARAFLEWARDDVAPADTPLAALDAALRAAVASCAHASSEGCACSRAARGAGPSIRSTRDLRVVYLTRLAPAPTGTLSTAARDHLRRGLRRAHAQGVAHGDVAFQNIMVGADGGPRLDDWGCAVVGATPTQLARDVAMLEAALERPPSVERRAKARRRVVAAEEGSSATEEEDDAENGAAIMGALCWD